jgi:hypothetical protein
LKRGGHIKAIGAGINALDHIPLFIDTVPLDFFLVALPYTLLEHRRFLEQEMPLLTARGIGMIIGAVFSSGIGATGRLRARASTTSPRGRRSWRMSGRSRRCARPTACLLRRPPFTPSRSATPPSRLSFPARSPPEQVKSNVALYSMPIPDSFWTELVGAPVSSRERPLPAPTPTLMPRKPDVHRVQARDHAAQHPHGGVAGTDAARQAQKDPDLAVEELIAYASRLGVTRLQISSRLPELADIRQKRCLRSRRRPPERAESPQQPRRSHPWR